MAIAVILIALGVAAALALRAQTTALEDDPPEENTDIDDMQPTGTPLAQKALQMALAVGRAEGYGASPTNKPTRQNNPCDITENGVVATYPTYEIGLAKGVHQMTLMLTGQSHYYRLDMSFRDVAQIYTGGGNPLNVENWATVVAEGCGCTVDTTLRQYVEG